jgi:hypothetical protein
MTSLFAKDGEDYEANFMKYFTATSIAHIVNQMINLCLVIFVGDDQNLPKLLHCHPGCSDDMIYIYAAIAAVTGALILSLFIAAWIYLCLVNAYQEISQTDYELRPMRR